MNTITIRKSTTAPTGYEVVDGDKVLPITDRPAGEPFTLILPSNSANRKYFSSKKVDAAGGSITVDYKETKTIGPRIGPIVRTAIKPLEDYLEGDDKVQYLALQEKAKAVRIEANKPVPMTELEKAKRAKERADAAVAKLLAEEENRQKLVLAMTAQAAIDALGENAPEGAQEHVNKLVDEIPDGSVTIGKAKSKANKGKK